MSQKLELAQAALAAPRNSDTAFVEKLWELAAGLGTATVFAVSVLTNSTLPPSRLLGLVVPPLASALSVFSATMSVRNKGKTKLLKRLLYLLAAFGQLMIPLLSRSAAGIAAFTATLPAWYYLGKQG